MTLTELLIALARQSAADQRAIVEDGTLEGEALAQALTSLALIEASEAARLAERERLLEAITLAAPASDA